MINEKNATYFFVGNVANGIADNAAYTGMASGSIAVVKALDHLNEESDLSASAALQAAPVRIVQKKADGSYLYSPIFTYADIVEKSQQDYVANVQQVSYWGYDGTTISLGTPVAGDTYTLHFVLNHSRNTYNNASEIKTVPYKATGTTQSALALGLLKSFLRQFSTLREPNPVIKAERINSGAQAVALNNLNLTNGSKYFTSADDDTATLVNGVILRIEEPENNGAATTDPCYIVVGNDGGAGAARVYELDVPFQGTTNADHDQCETVTEGNWGLKFTGIAQPFDATKGDSLTNSLVVFDITSEDFGTITEYKATRPKYGTGTYQQVSYMEHYSQYMDRDAIISKRPLTKFRSETTSGAGYDLTTLKIKASSIQFETIGQTVNSYITIVIATQQTPVDLALDALDTVFFT